MKLLPLIIIAIIFCIVPAHGQTDLNSISDKLFNLKRDGRFDEAIADLNVLIKANPNDPKLYIKKAEFLALQEKFDEAIVNVNKAVELEPKIAVYYIERAKYFSSVKNNQAVLKDVQTANSLAPDKPDILFYGTSELARTGQYEESIKIANTYIARHDSNVWLIISAYKIRSEDKFALKDYVGALEDSIKSIELIPPFTGDLDNDVKVRIEISNLTQLNVIQPIMRKHLREDERIFDYYNRIFDVLGEKVKLCNKYCGKGEYKIRDINTDEEVDFGQFAGNANLRDLMIDCANLYVEKGEPEKAVELFGRIVKLKQPTWAGYWDRARFYKKLGKYQEAIDDLTTIINLKNAKPLTASLVQRADLYVLTNEFDKAIADYESVKVIDKNLEGQMNARIVLVRQKMFEKNIQPK